MCLDTGRALKGTSKEWVPAWKEVMEWGEVFCTPYRLIELRRANIIPPGREDFCLPFADHPKPNTYKTGFHAWLKRPPRNAQCSDTTKVVRVFLRKLTARGKQGGAGCIVGREMRVPYLKKDGTRKKQ